MDVWLVYRIYRAPGTREVERFEPIEWVDNEVDARKDQRFFDLQVPLDLRDKIVHGNVLCGRAAE